MKRIREITRKAKGVSIEKTIEKLASYIRGLAQLFRLLRNACGAGVPDPLGPVAIACSAVAAMENTAPSPAQHCWNWEFVRDWLATRPGVDAAPGTSLGPKPSRLGFPTPTSNRSDFQR
jgi:hypothetical protein